MTQMGPYRRPAGLLGGLRVGAPPEHVPPVRETLRVEVLAHQRGRALVDRLAPGPEAEAAVRAPNLGDPLALVETVQVGREHALLPPDRRRVEVVDVHLGQEDDAPDHIPAGIRIEIPALDAVLHRGAGPMPPDEHDVRSAHDGALSYTQRTPNTRRRLFGRRPGWVSTPPCSRSP